jgi:hypothetical protein
VTSWYRAPFGPTACSPHPGQLIHRQDSRHLAPAQHAGCRTAQSPRPRQGPAVRRTRAWRRAPAPGPDTARRGPVRAAILIAHASQEPLFGEEPQRVCDDAARSRRGEPPVLGRRGLRAAQVNAPRSLQPWGPFQRVPVSSAATEGTVVIEQGRALGRPSRIQVSVTGDQVTVGGSGIVVADGTIRLEQRFYGRSARSADEQGGLADHQPGSKITWRCWRISSFGGLFEEQPGRGGRWWST